MMTLLWVTVVALQLIILRHFYESGGLTRLIEFICLAIIFGSLDSCALVWWLLH